MAKQKGVIKLKGTIDDFTFYQTADGHLARQKGTLDADRIANDPAFIRTRENGAEFSRAGKAGKVLRVALRQLLQRTSDRLMVGRLTREMMKVLKADLLNPRGMRNVIDGEAELLKGFEFNVNSKLGTTLFAPFTTSINRATGELSVSFVPFVPANMIAAPAGATHFRIISAGVEINFESEDYTAATNVSADLPLSAALTAPITLTNAVTANSTHPLFLALGIEFYQQVNGISYALSNGAFNSLVLAAVSGE